MTQGIFTKGLSGEAPPARLFDLGKTCRRSSVKKGKTVSLAGVKVAGELRNTGSFDFIGLAPHVAPEDNLVMICSTDIMDRIGPTTDDERRATALWHEMGLFAGAHSARNG